MTTDLRPDARPVLHCTCATGTCARTGHVPQLANCGHPGVYRNVRIIAPGEGTTTRSVCHRDACRLVAEKLTGPWTTQVAVGRAIGALTGVSGRPGGWIHDDQGTALTHGWASYAHMWVGQRSGGISTIDYQEGHGYLIGETGLRRVAAHLERRAGKSS